MTVKNTHKDYDKFSPKWERCSDCVDGQDAIHKGGKKYLPKLKDEEPDEYEARVKRSDFYNATWRTISGLSGMAFRKEPNVAVPAAIEPMLKDITMSGVDMTAFAREIVEGVLEYGRMGILVDHPPKAENVTALTLKVAEDMGLRPSMQLYDAKCIRNWRYARVANAYVLKMVVLGETGVTEADEFEEKTEDRYRVLDLDEAGNYRQRVYAVRDGKDVLVEGPIYPEMNGRPLGYIPFVIVGPNGMGAYIDEPPLIDLVDANVAHYQVNADYRHGLHFTGLPTLFLAGVSSETSFYIGSSKAICADSPEAKGMFIEFTGKGLDAVKEALDKLEWRMALLGARMLADETDQAETLGATQIKRSGENGVLAAIVIGVSGALEWALDVFAQWAGASGEIVYQINREFTPVPMDAQTLTALVAAWQNGALSDGDLFDMLKRGDVIDSEKTLEDHQAEVDASEPTTPAKPSVPANDGEVIAA